jgi:hypothetical protein
MAGLVGEYMTRIIRLLTQLIQGGDAAWLPERRAQSSVAPFTSRHRAWIVNGAGVGGIG